jgi:serine/threonine protein kinase
MIEIDHDGSRVPKVFICTLSSLRDREPRLYRLHHIRTLGLGSSSMVYLVEDIQTNRRYAMKLPHRSTSKDELEHEISIYHDLVGCPGILPMHFFGLFATRPVLLLEPHVPLHQLVKSMREMDLNAWAGALVSALRVLHSKGFIHRDVKPSNLFLSESTNQVFLGDFGFACRVGTTSDGFCGTESFASDNALREGTPCPDDDFESLCYSLYFLESKGRISKSRPSLSDLTGTSSIVRHLRELWSKFTRSRYDRKAKKRKSNELELILSSHILLG